MRSVVVVDTSILCCYLDVPGRDTAGPLHNRWNHTRARNALDEEEQCGSIIVLPLATIIETGNHIAQAIHSRYEVAHRFSLVVQRALDGHTPWAPFVEQAVLWEPERLRSLAERWPDLAAASQSLGDSTIVEVAEYYSQSGSAVKILTADEGLQAYEPTEPTLVPRRRR